MTNFIPPAEAAAKLTAYGVALFESLKEIKKQYPDQVRDLYRAMVKHVVADEPEVAKECMR